MLGTSLAFIDFNCFTSQVCCSLHVKLLRLFKPGLYEPDHIYSEWHKLQLTRSPVFFFYQYPSGLLTYVRNLPAYLELTVLHSAMPHTFEKVSGFI